MQRKVSTKGIGRRALTGSGTTALSGSRLVRKATIKGKKAAAENGVERSVPTALRVGLDLILARFKPRKESGAKGDTIAGVQVALIGSGERSRDAARWLAARLHLSLHRVDVASVVEQYIGETEKNLAKIFDEAGRSKAVLFFDEADALFGKRSSVKDSRDRYANQEISYLLKRIEAYPGVVLLSMSEDTRVDRAFLRRLDGTIELSEG